MKLMPWKVLAAGAGLVGVLGAAQVPAPGVQVVPTAAIEGAIGAKGAPCAVKRPLPLPLPLQ